MINFLGKIPHKIAVACSGGVDSMAILSFLRNGKKDVTCLYFNHHTEHSIKTLSFINKYCKDNDISLIVGEIQNPIQKGQSQEEYWRIERYNFINSYDGVVITAHHLNDSIETWLFTCMNGNPFLIPYQNKNVIRPFLITPKNELENWCIKKNVPWENDESNKELHHARNRIRHNIVPEVLKINPGIEKVIKRKIIAKFNESLS